MGRLRESPQVDLIGVPLEDYRLCTRHGGLYIRSKEPNGDEDHVHRPETGRYGV